MNQLISWQPYKGDTGKCENCGMTKDVSQKKGCCTDKQHFVKSNTDHKLQPVFGLQASIHFTALPSAYIGWPASRYTAILPTATPQQTRPIPMGPALYLRNAVFRI
ncbi:MAG: hypothetical protein EOO03_03245 [Chitinophagaceae bacterium]|nr:MAG: hypothetical protein EOO03_03245 [Chitinophagaceae bacterium]